jgi:hypothetical protein
MTRSARGSVTPATDPGPILRFAGRLEGASQGGWTRALPAVRAVPSDRRARSGRPPGGRRRRRGDVARRSGIRIARLPQRSAGTHPSLGASGPPRGSRDSVATQSLRSVARRGSSRIAPQVGSSASSASDTSDGYRRGSSGKSTGRSRSTPPRTEEPAPQITVRGFACPQCAREDSNLWPLPPEGSTRRRPAPIRKDLRGSATVCVRPSGVWDRSVVPERALS